MDSIGAPIGLPAPELDDATLASVHKGEGGTGGRGVACFLPAPDS